MNNLAKKIAKFLNMVFAPRNTFYYNNKEVSDLPKEAKEQMEGAFKRSEEAFKRAEEAFKRMDEMFK